MTNVSPNVASDQQQQQQDDWRQLVNFLPIVVWVFDTEGKVIFVNRFNGFLDPGVEEHWWRMVHPESREQVRETWLRALRSKTSFEMEYQLRVNTGEYKWFLGRIRPIYDDTGKVVKWFGTSTEIEEQKMALSAREAFLSIVSHELKSPLTALKLQVENMLTKLEDPEHCLRHGHDILRLVQRFERLVSELLDVSRISQGRFILEIETVDFVQIIRETVSLLRPTIERVGCTVNLRLGDKHIGHWDKLRMEQVVTNLLSNALKYGKGKPIDIELTEKDGMTLLKVKDYGIGIPEIDLKRIFARYEQVLSTPTYGGYGLGLWIVREIVEAHGGEIMVNSEENVGSIFTVELPTRRLLSEQ